jgi:hypothetical protein
LSKGGYSRNDKGREKGRWKKSSELLVGFHPARHLRLILSISLTLILGIRWQPGPENELRKPGNESQKPGNEGLKGENEGKRR